MSFNQHIQEINKVRRQLISFASPIQDEKLINLINENTDKYIKIFTEAFPPEDKKIQEDTKYYADVRSLAKYNENLVNGWLIEDFYMYIFTLPIFKKHGFEVSITNHDLDRVIAKKRAYINANPDFTIKYKDITFDLEIQALFLNLNKFYIKENKVKKAINGNSFIYQLLLGRQETVYFFPFSLKQGHLEENQRWGGKKAYRFFANQIPEKRKIKGHSMINDFIMNFYIFSVYKKHGEKKFLEFGKECLNLNRKEIIQKAYDML